MDIRGLYGGLLEARARKNKAFLRKRMLRRGCWAGLMVPLGACRARRQKLYKNSCLCHTTLSLFESYTKSIY